MSAISLSILWTIALALPPLLGSWFWVQSRAISRFASASEATRWVAVAVLCWSWVTLGVQLLGSLGGLSRFPLLAWSCGGLGLGLLGRWFPARPVNSAEPIAHEGSELVTEVPSLAAWLAVTVTLWAWIQLTLDRLVRWVQVVSDGPIYHLYFAARWWKAESLSWVAAPFGETAATYFPANGDLWFSWLMVAWGSETLAKVGQSPFLGLVGLAVIALSRELGMGRRAAIIAACLGITSTPLLIFSVQPNVDTIFVAGYLASCLFLLKAWQDVRSRRVYLILAGLALGCAWGTKAPAIVFVAPLVAIVGLLLVVDRSRGWGERLLNMMVWIVASMLLYAFWPIRNLVLTGNPIYPLHIEFLGTTLLSGWYPREAMATSPYFVPMGNLQALNDTLFAAIDPRIMIVLGVAVVMAILGRSGHSIDRGRLRWLTVLALVNVAIFWILVPYRTQQRFLLQAVVLFSLPIGALMDRSRWLAWLGTIILVLHVLTEQSFPVNQVLTQPMPWDLSPEIPTEIPAPFALVASLISSVEDGRWIWVGINLLTGIFLAVSVWLSLTLIRDRSGWVKKIAATATVWLLAVASASLVTVLSLAPILGQARSSAQLLFYPPSFPDYYPGWMALERASGPEGVTVAYAGTNLPYYLLGSGLRNRVRAINVNEHRDWLMHDYHRDAIKRGEASTWPTTRPGWDRLEQDRQAWLENLEREQVDLLVVTRAKANEGQHLLHDVLGFPIERSWAESMPERFQPVYGVREDDREFRIYRLIRDRS